jgi:hypothetical protein
MISQNENGDQSAITRSAISAGTINVTDGAHQTQDIARHVEYERHGCENAGCEQPPAPAGRHDAGCTSTKVNINVDSPMLAETVQIAAGKDITI